MGSRLRLRATLFRHYTPANPKFEGTFKLNCGQFNINCMPDFGSRWKHTSKEPEGRGGQATVFHVEDLENPGGQRHVAKVLNGANLTPDSPRWKRIEEEIHISKSFDHPNVVCVVDSGRTINSGYPYFVMPYYSNGSLEKRKLDTSSPGTLFRLFATICDGVAHIHSKGVIHRDLKPANIFLDGDRAVVGDLGLCFRIDADSLTETLEVATARWFGAPELRNGHLESPSPSADIYSLGKLLYWLLTRRVYDREEQDYGSEDRKLYHVLCQIGNDRAADMVNPRLAHAGAFADEIVSRTVRYEPSDRLQTAGELASEVKKMIDRFEAGGRALDLRLPQSCLYCGKGAYKPVVIPPSADRRANPTNTGPPNFLPGIWDEMRNQTERLIGHEHAGSGVNHPVPLYLICDYCANMQVFRWDRCTEAQKNWLP